ncbi:FAD dependent oxidoreductase [Aaosphaeria arxii CBS 175.79]|uniref:FAD dependent oxidoreductase n=1 Tax=Aaosphaeria arxii CBS 175.79 TaxID=1450172 RepID=A0A6A5X8F1_9PLEO|nr:FAD dependent oxidoreductase [Aaosphaeria arxii CBS 175.79]KAF2009034.1 FAD dependent oxidoreductase [Aaosphaeria arxii CBS 175.79]
MSTWLDTPTYAAQFNSSEDFNGSVPRPDDFPEIAEESRSYWIREHRIDLDHTQVDTHLPTNVDVVIIGSGITGAVAALRISEKKPELRTALVEARGICTGATGRNGGFIARPECYHLVKTAKIIGTEDAIKLRKFGNINRDMMLDCIEKLGLSEDVDLRLNGNINVFETQEEKDNALEDIKFAKENGFEPEGYYLDPEATTKKFGLDAELCRYGSALLERAGTFYPRKFVHNLLLTALERMPNLTIHPYTPVEAVRKVETPDVQYEIRTPRGTITSKAVFHATNAYAGNICPPLKGSNGVFGAKAHLLALSPNTPGNRDKQLKYGFGYADFWHYLHQRPAHGSFLYGLADAEILNDYDDSITLPTDHPVRAKMAEMLERNFPDWFENLDLSKDVTHDWTGIQGLTMTGASIVGRPSIESPGEFASVGHNGEGMGRCFASGTVASDAMLAYLDGSEYSPPDWFPHCYRRNI